MERIELAQRVIRAIWNTPKPVLAAVEGSAYGAGTALAAACDRVVGGARRDIRYHLHQCRLVRRHGHLRVVAGPRRNGAGTPDADAAGADLRAGGALEWASSTSVAEPGQALESARRDARQLAAGPSRAYGVIKALLADPGTVDPFRDRSSAKPRCQSELFDTDDFAEGIAAFRERRRPVFGATGRSATMTSVIHPAIDTDSPYDRLIKRDKVHGSLYTDPAIFAEELEQDLVPHLGFRRPRERSGPARATMCGNVSGCRTSS